MFKKLISLLPPLPPAERPERRRDELRLFRFGTDFILCSKDDRCKQCNNDDTRIDVWFVPAKIMDYLREHRAVIIRNTGIQYV